jgi:hypothetical protein
MLAILSILDTRIHEGRGLVGPIFAPMANAKGKRHFAEVYARLRRVTKT